MTIEIFYDQKISFYLLFINAMIAVFPCLTSLTALSLGRIRGEWLQPKGKLSGDKWQRCLRP